jgi:RNA-binding protein
MSLSLTGAEKKTLRAQGQLLSDSLRVGREGAVAPVIQELDRLLVTRQLVKVRFIQADREQRGQLADQLAAATQSACIAAVGRTALFYRRAVSDAPTAARA